MATTPNLFRLVPSTSFVEKENNSMEEEDPATPLTVTARASARSASFDVELGESRGGFEELTIDGDEEEEEEEEDAAPSTPGLQTPPSFRGRRRRAPPPPPFTSFAQPAAPSASSPIAAKAMPMSRRKGGSAREEAEGRYRRSPPRPSRPSPSSPLPLQLELSLSTTPRAATVAPRCALDDPPFDRLDPAEEGSTTFAHLPRDVQLRILALVPQGGSGSGGAASASSSGASSGDGACGSKRGASLACRLFRDLLLDGEAWPRVDLSPVTARSAAWLARRAGRGGGGVGCYGESFGSLEEGNNKGKAASSSPSSSSSSTLSLSSSSHGIREVTLRPSTEQQAVLFNDVFLATAPGIASLAIETPWHAAPLANFSVTFWALKSQRSLRHLRVKVQEVDFEALPPGLESLDVECSRFAPVASSARGGIGGGGGGGAGGGRLSAEEQGEGEENEEETSSTASASASAEMTAEAAAAAAALPSLSAEATSNHDGGGLHRPFLSGLQGLRRLTALTRLDLSVWSHGGAGGASAGAAGVGGASGASGWQDLSPLLALTRLRSLSLNSHPFEMSSTSNGVSSSSSANDETWSKLGSTMPDLRSLTLSAAPGFDAALPSLSPYCDLRFFTRGGFRESLARSYAANLVSLELKDLAVARFDARVLGPCRRLAALDVSFAADAGVVEGLEAVAGSLRTLKTGCPALRLVLPPMPCLEELEAVAFHDLDLSVDRAACAALLSGGGRLRSVYLAALDFGVGMHVFVHEAGRRGLDLRFATRPLRAVFTPDQLPAMDLDGNGVEVVG